MHGLHVHQWRPGAAVLGALRAQLGEQSRLEPLLAGLLAFVCMILDWQYEQPWAIVLDLSICTAAGFTLRLPRLGGSAVAALLSVYLVVPLEWATMGEYAGLIPILGAGVRGRRPERRIMSAVYGALWVALAFRESGGGELFLLAVVLWAAIIAVVWLIGGAFANYARAKEQAREAALIKERHALARDLHDTVARTLTLVALRARRARDIDNDGHDDLDLVAEGVDLASRQLRWVMSVLRDQDSHQNAGSLGLAGPTALTDALREGVATLRAHGYEVSVSVDGDLGLLAEAQSGALSAAVGEVVANIIRHGDERGPCAIIISRSASEIDMVFLNQPRSASGAETHPTGLGLVGLQERLIPVGGRVHAEPNPTSWLTRITVPVSDLRHT